MGSFKGGPFKKGLLKRPLVFITILNYKSVNSPTERFGLLLQSALGALQNPVRADLVAETGDLSS